MPRFIIALCAAQLFLAGAVPMTAQDSNYDNEALRVETRGGGLKIVRGIQGTVVARGGMFHGPRLANLVTRSDSALAEARVFERDYQPGQYALGLAIMTFGAAVGVWRTPAINQSIATGLVVASVVSIAYAALKIGSAGQALSKAIWWYNRDLKK
jgi:hypothetical protein